MCKRSESGSTDCVELERFLDRIQPGWREVVVERRFLARMVAASTLPLASHGGLAGRPAHQSDTIKNLYVGGDWVGGHGLLIDASLASARAVARSVTSQARAGRASEVVSVRAA
ncbi:MAG: hypothetical protein NVSMB2_11480 [Chloroflexota bacterium]